MALVRLLLFGTIFVFSRGDSFEAVPKPNFVFIINDDQDLLLQGSIGMEYTTDMMVKEGASLSNFFSNTPVCCPSRTTLLSGQYAHNWHTTDAESCMFMDLRGPEFWRANIGVHMQNLGYTTGAFGKLLNLEIGTIFCDEDTAQPIPGFNSTLALCNEFAFYNNIWNVNGTIEATGEEPKDYMTSVIGNASLKFMHDSLEADRPFFLFVGPHAPHLPATPAPWYMNEFANISAPRTPNYNSWASHHHYLVRSQPPMTAQDDSYVDNLFRYRSRSLLSVDDIVKDIVNMLTKYGEIDNTYIVFTSDHGYQLGQFRMRTEKEQPYDNHIRVPFVIRGPKIPQVSFQFMASIVDIAPTLLEIAGGDIPITMDGHSFAKQLTTSLQGARDKHLIEYWSVGKRVVDGFLVDLPNNTFIGIRLLNATHDYLYAEFYASNTEVDFHSPIEYELFNLSNDPWQLHNLYGNEDMEELVSELYEYLHQEIVCKGQFSCRSANDQF